MPLREKAEASSDRIASYAVAQRRLTWNVLVSYCCAHLLPRLPCFNSAHICTVRSALVDYHKMDSLKVIESLRVEWQGTCDAIEKRNAFFEVPPCCRQVRTRDTYSREP